MNLGVAIDETTGSAPFLVDGSFSGLDAEGHLWRSKNASARISVPTRRLEDVLDDHATAREIDLLDVDCEGRELEVLRSNNWEKYRPRIVMVELHPGAPNAPARFIEEREYRLVCSLDITHIFERS